MLTASAREKLHTNEHTADVVEAVSVDLCNGTYDGGIQHASVEQPPTTSIIVYQYPPSFNPPVRSNGDVQCCYPITVADPEEMVQARIVAIAQVALEATGIFFCRSGWCFFAFLIGVPTASVVACCSKHRATYLLWSCQGALLCLLHAVATAEAFSYRGAAFWVAMSGTVQVILCVVGLLVMYSGCKVASLLRDAVHPAGMEVPAPQTMQSSPVVSTQIHYVQGLPP